MSTCRGAPLIPIPPMRMTTVPRGWFGGNHMGVASQQFTPILFRIVSFRADNVECRILSARLPLRRKGRNVRPRYDRLAPCQLVSACAQHAGEHLQKQISLFRVMRQIGRPHLSRKPSAALTLHCFRPRISCRQLPVSGEKKKRK